MNPAAWERVKSVLADAADLSGPDRERLVADRCPDLELRREVLELLASPAPLSDILATGAFKTETRLGSELDVPLSEPIPRLESGFRLGPYRIAALIGAGGMGEVYRARDTTLGRDVAIKILPRAFTNDPERLSRFQREARILAALNHPCIGAIYGFEEANGVRGLVLELVEGPTLADRLSAGPLPVQEALRIAGQIADALDAAHEKGIVHRDLKPANVKITPDAIVKVLDFGLAKVIADEASGANLAQSPVAAAGATRVGMLLGTAAYMSPEQARGQVVDKRADVWAFGCVLYEMLTGRAALGRDTVSDTIAAILERDPAWDRLPAKTPANIRQLLRRCLEKDPKRRLRDIGDARIEIDDAGTASAIETGPARPAQGRQALAWSIPLLIGVAAVVLGTRYLGRIPQREPLPTRFSVALANNDVIGIPALSPDGRRLAFVARRDGVPILWVRSLEAIEPQPLAGTEGAGFPFWSPDSRSVGFFSGGLKIIDELGGNVRALGQVASIINGYYGAMWTPDGRIVVGTLRRGLFTISAKGGSPVQLTTFDVAHGEGGQLFPTMLPDGQHFLYLSAPSNTVWVASLNSQDRTRLISADSQVVYVPGYLLFVRGQTLLAQPFDAQSLRVTGNAEAVAERVLTERLYGADFTASSTGVLAYRTGTLNVPTQLTWTDRAGHVLGTPGPPGRYANLELSPDGTRAVMEALETRSYTKNIWVMELGRGLRRQLTFGARNEVFPIWSPDGRWIMFGTDREDGWLQLYQKRADGVGAEERVLTSANAMVPQHWAPDGRSVVYLRRPSNLDVLSLVGARTARPFDPARFEGTGRYEGYGQVSPDGRWLAYGSNESGRWEIYIQSFPTPGGGKWLISKDGGMSPRWRRDGRELFYYAGDGQLVAVPISNGTTLQIGAPVPLFKADLLGGPIAAIPWRSQYDVTADGQRLLLNVPMEDPTAREPITVVTNWMSTLNK